jgi:hypothetical protein
MCGLCHCFIPGCPGFSLYTCKDAVAYIIFSCDLYSPVFSLLVYYEHKHIVFCRCIIEHYLYGTVTYEQSGKTL